jgi:D-alanyl-lipoteichoic acid acyltransferase DltB (MBOAT superfamily)
LLLKIKKRIKKGQNLPSRSPVWKREEKGGKFYMIFSSYTFLFKFLPIVFTVYFLLNRLNFNIPAKYWLALSSLFFYWYGSGYFVPFFIGSVIFNYVTGMVLNKYREKLKLIRRSILTVGILGNVTLLGYYKYMDFIIANINFFTDKNIPLPHIPLPIGISFFTFQLIAYLVDSYRGETKEYSFLNYLLFITFFPQLIVGPIVHHKDVVPQYESPETSLLNYNNIATGVFLFSMGCAKKILMADPLTAWAQPAFDHAQELTMVESWFSSVSYTLSYYFDLSGYADMAIALGLMFNVNIPINFNSPYKARNFADYWRRWHITLSRFLGDYIFRSIFNKGDSSRRFYFAIFITFLVSGFWHGAGWTFVVWGIFNGIFVIFAHMMTRAGKRMPFFLAWFLTFSGVVLVRILFVSGSFSDAIYVMKTLLDFSKLHFSNLPFASPEQAAYIFIGALIVFFLPNSLEIKEKFQPNFKFALFSAILLVFSIMNMSSVGDFLYFQF